MPTVLANNAGNSGAEEKFIQLFCEVFGPEKGQYVYLQYPFVDIYGKHRTIDFAFKSNIGRIAVEIDGTTWHNPVKVSEDKYIDDLLKQNSMVHDGWKVYRWTDAQLNKTPERIKDELVTFFGTSPLLLTIDDNLPEQSGKIFSLREHQEEALANLHQMRVEGQSIALIKEATGSGKSAISIFDAKAVNKRTLFLAHTKELVLQGYDNFKRFWSEESCGRYVDEFHESDQFNVCASVQSIVRNLEDFDPYQFGYIIIDECHHAAADTYQKILAYFKPNFTLGLTATDERADGEDLLKTFQKVAHRLDIEDAVEQGILVPVRCIRIKTNIDLRDVRINGFKYNSLDLESKVVVPGRNQLIVDTYLEYVKNKSTVVFCTSVDHAQKMEAAFREKGIAARSISGSTKTSERRKILRDYENGTIKVLCACDLLNEGWDSPHTEVLFMARPTMSKTIYMQQLGRGMRTCEGKEFLMVFDFVDNANMFNCPYSLHRLFNVAQYTAGGLVLGKKHNIKWENEMFKRGEKPDALIDYPIYAIDYELIDLFNWQEQAKDMISQAELTRRVSAQSETIDKYIRDGKIIADLEVPISEHKTFKYFNPDRIPEYCTQFGWKLITAANIKDMFMDMASRMTMSYSYKPVFILAFLNHMSDDGDALLEAVVEDFAGFYEDRIAQGLPAEKKKCLFTKGSYTEKDVERLILSMPFKRFEDMGFMHHAKYLGTIQLDRSIVRKLTDADKNMLKQYCKRALDKYFGTDTEKE